MTQPNETLAELVSKDATRARTLDRLGLDYCCAGNDRLDDACDRAGLDVAEVLMQLDATAIADDDQDCAQMRPAELIGHLVGTHHTYLHAELLDLDLLAHKVLRVHGERHPELHELYALVSALRDDLTPHMLKEERVLFPSILELINGPARLPFGPITNPIKMMSIEHERAGGILTQLRTTSNGYTVPDDACASYRSLYQRLIELEHDTHLHIFEENHLLFPQAVALAAEWA
jgi:regulator of cell morphogenesis and NO signaling